MAVAVIWVGALLLPAVSGAYIYWPNDTDSLKSIGRANQDGSNVDNDFVSTQVGPCGVASNGTYVYWTGGAGVGYVGRANIATQFPEDHFIQTANDLPCGVAVDESHVYFNNYILGAIGRANLNGGDIDNTFITGGINPQHPAVSGGNIYWSNKGYGCPPGCTVGRSSIAGAGVDQNFVTGTHDPPSGVAVDSAHVYWGNGDYVGRSNLAGTVVEPTFLNTGDFVCAVAVDSSHLYWARYGGGDDSPAGSIGRANLDGSGMQGDFISTAGGTCGVAVDGLLPSNDFNFTVVPRITCAGTCRVVLVKISFDSEGRVIAQQVLPGQEAAVGSAPASSGKKKKKGKSKPKVLIKKLKQNVTAGPNKLKLKLTKTGKKRLKKKGKLKIRVKFTFTPTGGEPKSKVKTIKVIRK